MAVYTEIRADQIKQFLHDKTLGQYRKHQGITQGVENSNFFLTTNTGTYILTLIEHRTNPVDLPFIYAYMQHLYKSGLPVPSVLAQGMIAGKPAVVVKLLDGASIYDDQTTPDHCAQIGTALARMHRAVKSFNGHRQNPVGPQQWQSMYDAVKDKIDPALAAVITREISQFTAFDWRALPAGAIHADLFRDNVFFDEHGRLSGIIDFYFACEAPFAYDLDITINAWCFDRANRMAPARLKAMLDAYETLRPLSPEEKKYLPDLRRAAALRFLMTRLYDSIYTPATATVVKKDPMEYLAKLQSDVRWP